MDEKQRQAKALIDTWWQSTEECHAQGIVGHTDQEWDRLEQAIAHALTEERRDGLKEAAKVVNGLMGKESGNWNRAIIYTEAAIRAKAQGQLLESTNPSQNSSCASSCESLYDGLRHDDFNADS